MSPREECRLCGLPFRPHPDDPDACAVCFTLSRAATIRELETFAPGDDEVLDEEPDRGA